MKYTANHKLKLPEPTDTLDIAVLDENFINIDALIAALQSGKAHKNSPQFTGTPKSVTPSASDNSTRIATTAFVQGLIQGLQTALSGKADKNSPSLTGTPTAPTAASGTNSTQIATTAFVKMLINELEQTELKPVTISNSFALISATGRQSFYHGTLSGFDEESSLLNNVQTTFGQAVFGKHYGSFNVQPGSEITLYIRLYSNGSQICWDEYYNDDIYANGEPVIEIGTATVSDYVAGGSTTCEFSYVNDDVEESKEYSLRDAVIELAKQMSYFNTGTGIDTLTSQVSELDQKVSKLIDGGTVTFSVKHTERSSNNGENSCGYITVTSAYGQWQDGTTMSFTELPTDIEAEDVDAYAVFKVNNGVVDIDIYAFAVPTNPYPEWGENYIEIYPMSSGTYSAKIYKNRS